MSVKAIVVVLAASAALALCSCSDSDELNISFVRKSVTTPIAATEAVADVATEAETEALSSDIRVATGEVNVRSTADFNADVLGQLQLGEQVEVISSENGWAKISYDGTDGYVFEEYLDSASQSTTEINE